MKKHFILASALMMFAACNKPAERAAIVNTKVAANVYAISELAEITSSKKAVLVSGDPIASVTAMDASLIQTKLEGKSDAILKKIISKPQKADLQNHLKSGAVAMIILKDQIKIFKIMADPAAAPIPPTAPEVPAQDSAKPTAADAAIEAAPQALEEAGPVQELLTMKYLNKLKEHAKSSDAQAQAAMEGELAQLKSERPSQIGEAFGFVEVASIKVEKFGILDNERTDYGEKKSLLNVVDTPFEMATHLIVGDEIKAKTTGEGEEASATEVVP